MKILLAGEGGQGVQLVGQLLAQACFLEKKPSLYIPNFGVEQRGGVSLAFVVSGKDSAYPKFQKADLLVIFCDRAYQRVKEYLDRQTRIIISPSVTPNLVPRVEKVNGDNFSPQVHNIIILGKILQISKLVKEKTIKKVIDLRLGRHFQKNPQLRKLDFQALEHGFNS